MKILITQAASQEASELQEYFQCNACEVIIAPQRRMIYQILAYHSINVVLFKVADLDDFTVIRYINTHYPTVKVIITSDAVFCSNIDNIRQGAFTSLKQPYHLDQLHDLIVSESS